MKRDLPTHSILFNVRGIRYGVVRRLAARQ